MSRIQAIKDFQDARFGMFIHWGLYSITARDMWYYSHEEIDKEEYEKLFHRFNPVDYDPDKWAELAKEAGMKYAVITAKHHDGFCLFDSQLTDFKVTNTSYGKDLLTPWVEAFRRAGIKVGFYYSLLDWHHPHFTIDKLHPQRNNKAAMSEERDWSKYVAYFHGQIRELLTNYGKIDILWPDFSYPEKGAREWGTEKLIDMVYRLMPDIIINNRLGVPCDFDTPEQYIPTRDEVGRPWENCLTMGQSWGYYRQDPDIKPVGQLIRILVDIVSKGGNLLLNVGPTPCGRIQDEFVERLKAIGKWLGENGKSIYGAGVSELTPPPDARYTRKGNTLYLHLFNYGLSSICLPGLAGKVQYATVLRDGTDVQAKDRSLPETAWLSGVSPKSQEDLEVFMPPHMVDPYDSVVALKLS